MWRIKTIQHLISFTQTYLEKNPENLLIFTMELTLNASTGFVLKRTLFYLHPSHPFNGLRLCDIIHEPVVIITVVCESTQTAVAYNPDVGV